MSSTKPKKRNWQRTNAYKELYASLKDNLLARGLVEQVYLDKVEEYMSLWCQMQELREDVIARGVTVKDEKRGMFVENRSVSLEIQVSRQMLNIYTALGFKDISTSPGRAEDDDDEL